MIKLIIFNAFMLLFGVFIGAMSVISQAKEFGYMKKDKSDGKLKWKHQIKNIKWDKKED